METNVISHILIGDLVIIIEEINNEEEVVIDIEYEEIKTSPLLLGSHSVSY